MAQLLRTGDVHGADRWNAGHQWPAFAMPLVLALGWFGCGAPPSATDGTAAIVGGAATREHPSVVLISTLSPSVLRFNAITQCTGAVISPWQVLTAAHCVDPRQVGNDAVHLVFIGDDISQLDTATDREREALMIPVVAVSWNQRFDDRNLAAGGDIAVLTLARELIVPPLPLNFTALSPDALGRAVTLVGYGADRDTAGVGRAGETSAGVKRATNTTLSRYTDKLLVLEDRDHNICSGDSGGPVLMERDGRLTVVGVVSYGDIGCHTGYATRVDVEVQTIGSARKWAGSPTRLTSAAVDVAPTTRQV